MSRIIKKIENCMIYIIMLLSFFMYCSLTQNTRIISIIIWPTVFLSVICIIYRIIDYKDYKINSFHKYVLIFVISYAVSSLLNITYGYYQNLRTLILMMILIGLVYTKSEDEKNSERTIKNVSITFLVITTVLSLASLCIFNINQIFINIFGENIYITGLRWGRVKGLYNDFNYGGIINSIAILIAVFFFNEDKKLYKKILYILTILINFAFISLCDSRTSLIALGLGIIVFYLVYHVHKVKSTGKKIGEIILISVITLVLLFAGKNCIKKIFTNIYDNEEEKIIINVGKEINIERKINIENTNIIISTEGKTSDNVIVDDNNLVVQEQEDISRSNINENQFKSQSESNNSVNSNQTITTPIIQNDNDVNNDKETEISIFDRGYSSDDISNRRFDLWKSSIEIFKTSPIFGVGFENIENYSYKNLPNTYLINNDYKEFDNFHNLIFNVLASQGIIGITILLIIFVYVSVNIIRYIKYLFKQNKKNNLIDALLITCVLIGFVSSMFIGDIIYYFSPSTVMFWFYLGYLINNIEESEQVKDLKIEKAIRKGNRILLINIFNLFPIKNNKIILDNFNGKGYGDNCKYVVEEINRRNLNYDLVWILKKSEDKKTLPSNVRFVKYNSIRYFYDICTAKIWIDNHRKIIDLKKRKEQYYIQTWHGGIALKKIERDAENVLEPKYVKQAIHDSKMIDLMVSNSKFCTEMYRRAFWYNGEILECGSPRNDIIVNSENVNVEDIYAKLGIDKNKKIILYAPTFRKNEELDCYNIDFSELINHLNNKTRQYWIAVFRLHPNIAIKSSELFRNENYDNIVDASNYADIYELMVVADIMITDYSSVMFEFSLKKKPVFLYATDIKDYINDRGFYFDYYKLPYTVSTNNKELNENIENYNDNLYKEKLNDFFGNIEIYEKGNASKTIVDIIEKKVKDE